MLNLIPTYRKSLPYSDDPVKTSHDPRDEEDDDEDSDRLDVVGLDENPSSGPCLSPGKPEFLSESVIRSVTCLMISCSESRCDGRGCSDDISDTDLLLSNDHKMASDML